MTTQRIIATADFGAIRKGQVFTADVITNSMGQTRLSIPDHAMPRATMHPTLFLGKDGLPDSGPAWNRFALA